MIFGYASYVQATRPWEVVRITLRDDVSVSVTATLSSLRRGSGRRCFMLTSMALRIRRRW